MDKYHQTIPPTELKSSVMGKEGSRKKSEKTGGGSEPLRKSYSREEMTAAAMKWMIENYPNDRTTEGDEKWCQRLGLFTHFIHDHFPENR